MSFRNRLMISILLLSTIPMLFVAFFSNRYSVLQSENEMTRYSTGMAQRSLNSFNTLFKSVSDSVLEIVSSPEISSFLRERRTGYEDLNPYDKQALNNKLDQINLKLFTIYSMNRETISGIYLLDGSSNEAIIFSGEYRKINFFRQVRALKGKQDWIVEKNPDDVLGGDGEKVDIYLASAVLNVTDDSVLGIIGLRISDEYIQRTLIGTQQEKGEYSFVLTRENRIIAHNNEQLIGGYYTEKALLAEVDQGKNGYKIMKLGNEKCVVTYAVSELNGWKIVNVIPYRNIAEKSVRVTSVMITIALLTMLAAVFIAITLSFSMYRPVLKLLRAMNQVDKGSLDIQVPVTQKDEFGQLGESFNMLMHRIRLLISQVEREQTLKKEAEMSALRAQVNPHFLYNTLHVVKCLAWTHEAEKIEQVVTGLIDLLRISIGNNREVISLEEEIRYVKSYILIQKHRLDIEFEVIDQIQEGLYKYAIPKFTLQPVIENAIIHGFQNSLTGNLISLRAFLNGADLTIEVSDNGMGMDASRQSDLQEFLDSPHRHRFNKVGIVNVSERIKLQFGSRYGIEIASYEGEGTKVSIRLPAIPADQYLPPT